MKRLLGCGTRPGALPLLAAMLVMAPAAFAAVAATPVAGPATTPAPGAAGALTIVDDTGATLRLTAPAQRIVSLAPGATEMLFAAGAGERIVATVMAADEPAAAKEILRIGDANALNYERLVALQPDMVVVWEDLTNRLVVESLRKLKMPLYFIRVKGLSDIPKSVRQLGRASGRTTFSSSR